MAWHTISAKGPGPATCTEALGAGALGDTRGAVLAGIRDAGVSGCRVATGKAEWGRAQALEN